MNIRKHILALITAGLLPLAGLGQWVSERPSELLASGDFDGDGNTDAAIVDKAQGVARIAYMNGSGDVEATLLAPTGIDGAEGASVGRLMQTNRDAIAVTGPMAGRIGVLVATNRLAINPPSYLFPSYPVGMNQALAIDIGGTNNNPALDDFFVASRMGMLGVVVDYYYQLVRNATGKVTQISEDALPAGFVRGNRIRLAQTGFNLAAFIMSGSNETLFVLAFTNGTPAAKLSIGGLPSNTHYACNFFTTTGRAHIITYQPGGTQLVFHAVSEPSFGNFTSTPAHTLQLPYPAGLVAAIPGTNRLVAMDQDGQRVDVINFHPSTGANVFQTMSAAGGQPFTGIIPRNLGFAIAAGTNAGARSVTLDSYAFDGSEYINNADPALLPSIRASSGRANVWMFANEPLVAPAPRLLNALNAADYSSSFRTSGIPAQVTVTSEVDAGYAAGLGSPAAKAMGSQTGAYVLVNQFTPYISISSAEPAAGLQPASASISPPAGAYPEAIMVSFSDPSPASLAYRVGDDGVWELYTEPFWVFTDTTVYYYLYQPGNPAVSPVQGATYTFTLAPENQDADGDGVPDFVEINYGLNPVTSGADGDGDGLTDLEELLGGTNPANPDSDGDGATDMEERRAGTDPMNIASVPTAEQIAGGTLVRNGRAAAFDVFVTPRPYFSLLGVGTNGLARTNTEGRVYGLDGSLYGFGVATTTVVSGVTNPHIRVVELPISIDPPLLAFATPDAYALSTRTNRVGREFIRLVAAPEVELPRPDYSYSGGLVYNESIVWLAAATSVWANIPRPEAKTFADVDTTLSAALFELKTEQILTSRLGLTNTVTLFPWRAGESLAYQPSNGELAALSARSGVLPAYNLVNVYTSIEHQVSNIKTQPITNLTHLARSMYRIASTNDTGYPLPFDALRHFIRTGTLLGAYTNLGVNYIVLSSAFAGATNILGAVPERPWVSLTLEARAPLAAGDCANLVDPVSSIEYTLVKPDGTSYDLAKSFSVISGSTFLVTGFLDGNTPASCTGSVLEVESVSLNSFVFPSFLDADGNLLNDDWEYMVFGGTGGSFTNDADGDGFSDLQEYLDGTDPVSFASTGVTPVVFELPDVVVAITGSVVNLSWNWPTNYLGPFKFTVQSTTSLSTNFISRTVVAGDNDTTLFGETSATSRFYRVGISIGGSSDPDGDGI